MKHPTREQLVTFFYEESPHAEKSELAQHLDSCPACRAQLQTFRATASLLNEYTTPTSSTWTKTALRIRSWLPLSAAAAVLLAAGIILGSSWSARANSAQSQLVAELRNRIENSELENAKTKKLLIELTQTIADNRVKDQAALVAVAQELQATRKDIETVAVLSEAGFKSAQHQFARLASYTPESQ